MNENSLTALSPDLWVTEGKCTLVGSVKFGTRMTIVRLQGGGLFVHSPISLSDPLQNEINALGEVQVIVAPNCFHHLFVAEFQKAYPKAKLYVAPGLSKKRKDLQFEGTLSDAPENIWADDLSQAALQGMPVINEIVFFHQKSKTLIVTDLVFNVEDVRSTVIRLLNKLNGIHKRFGPSRLFRLLIRDRKSFKNSFTKIMEWDFERIILTHGDVVESRGKERMKRAFGWL